MTIAGALHMPQGYQGRAIDSLDATNRVTPGVFTDFVMPGRQFGQQLEYAVDRAQILAPDALVTTIQKANDHRRRRRTAQHGKHRPGVLIDADQLAINSGEGKSDKWPAAPAHPFRNGPPPTMLAGPLAEHAFRTEPPAPCPPHQGHGDQHK